MIAEDFRPVETAIAYENAGAAAISCLTEEHYFKGGSKYFADIRVKVDIPMLRKDFIFDEYQIYEAKVLGADAILVQIIIELIGKRIIISFSCIS